MHSDRLGPCSPARRVPALLICLLHVSHASLIHEGPALLIPESHALLIPESHALLIPESHALLIPESHALLLINLEGVFLDPDVLLQPLLVADQVQASSLRNV
jgi:hypothetical protein